MTDSYFIINVIVRLTKLNVPIQVRLGNVLNFIRFVKLILVQKHFAVENLVRKKALYKVMKHFGNNFCPKNLSEILAYFHDSKFENGFGFSKSVLL